jgi:hypothetical protein
MTAVAGSTFTAAAFNTHVRDNLQETAPAKATAPSQLFVSTGPNAIAVRVPATDFVAATESTTATSYTDLATPGPSVGAVTGTIAIVFFAASASVATNNTAAAYSVAVSGATNLPASDTWAVQEDGISAGNWTRHGSTHVFTGLTPGINTFTMRYQAGASNTSFKNREISVIPL